MLSSTSRGQGNQQIITALMTQKVELTQLLKLSVFRKSYQRVTTTTEKQQIINAEWSIGKYNESLHDVYDTKNNQENIWF